MKFMWELEVEWQVGNLTNNQIKNGLEKKAKQETRVPGGASLDRTVPGGLPERRYLSQEQMK